MRMLRAGFGDMIAKYISICEWRIAHLVTGEYYCAPVADMMRAAVSKIMASVDGILARDPDAVGYVAEGLVLSGLAMAYANVSRPRPVSSTVFRIFGRWSISRAAARWSCMVFKSVSVQC